MKYQSGRMLLWSLLMLAAVTNTIGPIHAQDACCCHCRGTDGCHKVCRLVCETKKVTVVCWGMQTEDFCVPGPSSVCMRHVECVCGDDTDPKAPCTKPKKFPWTEWIPASNAKIYTKNKLMKRTITKTIPSFKWVVEDLCENCEAQVPIVQVPPGVEVPLPPVTNAKIIPMGTGS
jgi:hypothetical protein